MRFLFDAIGTPAHSTWLAILLDASFKGAILLAAVLLLSLLLRRAAAATRHLIWSLALIGLLALPALSFILPIWNVPLVPQILPSSQSFERLAPSHEYRLPKSKSQKYYQIQPRDEKTWTVSTSYSSPLTPVRSQSDQVKIWPSWDWPTWIFLIWVSGVAMVSARWLIGWLNVKLLSRRSQEILDDEWHELSEKVSMELGLKQPVKLLRAENAAVPMTWGFFRPVILLPDDAGTWSPERRRVGLLHELAHVKRGDLPAQYVAQIVCALYWFNPLAWIAARRLRLEREQACDDAVLNAGTRASEYANHILEILRSLRMTKCSFSAAVAMAQGSQIEERLRAILNPDLRRRALSPAGEFLMGAMVACVILPLAAISPWARFEKEPARSSDKFVLPNMRFQQIDPKFNINANVAMDPIVIEPWRAGSEEAAESPVSTEDCDEENSEKNLFNELPLDRFVHDGANAVGRSINAAIHALGVENIANERLVAQTADDIGRMLAEKLRDAGYDEAGINEAVNNLNSFDETYVQDVKKTGYPDLSIEQLLQMRIHGIDADYIKAMKAAGFDNLSFEELMQLRIHGVDAEYAGEMNDVGFDDLSIEELLQMRIHGVDAEYAREMNGAGFVDLSIEQLLQMRIHGVDAEYARAMKTTYGELSLEELLQLRIHGVDTEYAREMKAAGFGELSIDELLQLRIHGVDAEYAREMKAAGFVDLSTEELLQLRIQGVDTDYVKEMKTAGFKNLTTEQVLQMRIQGVDADFVKELQEAGLKNLSPEKVIQMKIRGFDARFFKE